MPCSSVSLLAAGDVGGSTRATGAASGEHPRNSQLAPTLHIVDADPGTLRGVTSDVRADTAFASSSASGGDSTFSYCAGGGGCVVVGTCSQTEGGGGARRFLRRLSGRMGDARGDATTAVRSECGVDGATSSGSGGAVKNFRSNASRYFL